MPTCQGQYRRGIWWPLYAAGKYQKCFDQNSPSSGYSGMPKCLLMVCLYVTIQHSTYCLCTSVWNGMYRGTVSFSILDFNTVLCEDIYSFTIYAYVNLSMHGDGWVTVAGQLIDHMVLSICDINELLFWMILNLNILRGFLLLNQQTSL